MSLFKLLFKFNPSKLKVIPAEQMSAKQQVEITNFLGDVVNRMLKGDFDTTPSQLKYLKDQGDEIARREKMIAERGSKGVGSLKPSAEVIDFPVTPKPPEGEPFAAGGVVKMIKKILSSDDLRKLAKKENIPEKDVEKFLSGESGILKRGQARGTVKRDKEGNIFIKDKHSEKYDPIRKQPVTDDDPGMFDDLFDRMFGEYELDKLKKSGRKPHKSGGKVKKSKTDKIIDFLGGKDVVAAELGLLGIEQLYNLLGMPLGFEKGGIVGDKSGPPPEKGPDSQGLETLFQNR